MLKKITTAFALVLGTLALTSLAVPADAGVTATSNSQWRMVAKTATSVTEKNVSRHSRRVQVWVKVYPKGRASSVSWSKTTRWISVGGLAKITAQMPSREGYCRDAKLVDMASYTQISSVTGICRPVSTTPPPTSNPDAYHASLTYCDYYSGSDRTQAGVRITNEDTVQHEYQVWLRIAGQSTTTYVTVPAGGSGTSQSSASGYGSCDITSVTVVS